MGNVLTRARRTLVGGRFLLPFLAGALACGGSARAPAPAAQATSDGRGAPAGSAGQPAKGDAGQPTAVVFKNVKVFDGKSDELTGSTSVLVVGNRIGKIGGDLPVPAQATVIDGDGRTLMPGLIDAHWHAMLVRPTATEALAWDVGYANLVAGAEARRYAAARVHHGARHGRARLRTEARHRRGRRRRPPHLSVGRHDHRDERPRRLSPAVRAAPHPREPADAHGTDRRQHDRRQSGRGTRARARAADAGREPDQADGRRRRRVAAQPPRRDARSPSPSCAPPWRLPRTGAPT